MPSQLRQWDCCSPVVRRSGRHFSVHTSYTFTTGSAVFDEQLFLALGCFGVGEAGRSRCRYNNVAAEGLSRRIDEPQNVVVGIPHRNPINVGVSPPCCQMSDRRPNTVGRSPRVRIMASGNDCFYCFRDECAALSCVGVRISCRAKKSGHGEMYCENRHLYRDRTGTDSWKCLERNAIRRGYLT